MPRKSTRIRATQTAGDDDSDNEKNHNMMEPNFNHSDSQADETPIRVNGVIVSKDDILNDSNRPYSPEPIRGSITRTRRPLRSLDINDNTKVRKSPGRQSANRRSPRRSLSPKKVNSDTKNDIKINSNNNTYTETVESIIYAKSIDDTAVESNLESIDDTAVESNLESKDDTAVESNLESKDDTPVEFKDDTPVEFKDDTPVESKDDTPVESKDDTPVEFKDDTPVESIDNTPFESKDDTPVESKDDTSVESNLESKDDTPVESNLESKDDTSIEFKDDTSVESNLKLYEYMDQTTPNPKDDIKLDSDIEETLRITPKKSNYVTPVKSKNLPSPKRDIFNSNSKSTNTRLSSDPSDNSDDDNIFNFRKSNERRSSSKRRSMRKSNLQGINLYETDINTSLAGVTLDYNNNAPKELEINVNPKESKSPVAHITDCSDAELTDNGKHFNVNLRNISIAKKPAIDPFDVHVSDDECNMYPELNDIKPSVSKSSDVKSSIPVRESDSKYKNLEPPSITKNIRLDTDKPKKKKKKRKGEIEIPNYDSFTPAQQKFAREKLKLMIKDLGERFKDYDLPEFLETESLETWHIRYLSVLQSLYTFDSTSRYHIMLLLVIGFIEWGLVKLNVRASGLLAKHVKYFGMYDHLLSKFAEKQSTGSGSEWHPMASLTWNIVVITLLLVVFNYLSAYLEPTIAGIIEDKLSSAFLGEGMINSSDRMIARGLKSYTKTAYEHNAIKAQNKSTTTGRPARMPYKG